LFSNPQTWKQRYLMNDEYWTGNFPQGCKGPSKEKEKEKERERKKERKK